MKTPITDVYESWFSVEYMGVEMKAVFRKMREMEYLLCDAYEMAEELGYERAGALMDRINKL